MLNFITSMQTTKGSLTVDWDKTNSAEPLYSNSEH